MPARSCQVIRLAGRRQGGEDTGILTVPSGRVGGPTPGAGACRPSVVRRSGWRVGGGGRGAPAWCCRAGPVWQAGVRRQGRAMIAAIVVPGAAVWQPGVPHQGAERDIAPVYHSSGGFVTVFFCRKRKAFPERGPGRLCVEWRGAPLRPVCACRFPDGHPGKPPYGSRASCKNCAYT